MTYHHPNSLWRLGISCRVPFNQIFVAPSLINPVPTYTNFETLNVSNYKVYIPKRVLNDWVLSAKSRWVVSKQQKRRFECHPWGMGPGELSHGVAAKLIWLNTDTYMAPPKYVEEYCCYFPGPVGDPPFGTEPPRVTTQWLHRLHWYEAGMYCSGHWFWGHNCHRLYL